MKPIISILLLLCFFANAQSQTITPEQEDVVFKLSKKTSKILAKDIINRLMSLKSDTNIINISILPATNAEKKITDFGFFYSKTLASHLNKNLNRVIIKKFIYSTSFSKSEKKNENKNNFDLQMSYFLIDSTLKITSAILSSQNSTISLSPHEVTGDISKITDLDNVTANTNFKNIINFSSNNNLFDSLKIYNSEKKELQTNNDNISLKRNENYKLRIYLKPQTYLYVFYYEPSQSSFYMIYPPIKTKNKPVTYKIKDIKNISFTTINNGIIKVIVSNKILNINEIITDNKTVISVEESEVIYRELLKNKNNLSTYLLKIKFK